MHLEARVADLEAKLNQNSTNSSKPPSTDPPAVKRAPPKPASGKKAGGQPGHPKHERALVDRPDHVPTASRPPAGGAAAPGRGRPGAAPAPGDRSAAGRPVVTEYRLHRLPCPCCGVTTCGDLPAGVAGRTAPGCGPPVPS